jgi:hypothetical protein
MALAKTKSIDEQVAEYKAKLEEKQKEAAAKKAEKDGEAFWDKEEVITMTPAATGKSATRVALCTRDNKYYVDIRKFVTKKGDAEGTFKQHTTHGISLEVASQADLTGIIASLQKAGSMMRRVTK